MVFELSRDTCGHLGAAICDADILASQNKGYMVVFFLRREGAHAWGLQPTDGHAKEGTIYNDPRAGETLIIYAPQPYDLDAETRAAYPDALDYSNDLYKFSKDFYELKERYRNTAHPYRDTKEIIKEAFGPSNTVIFLKQ